MQVEMGPSKIRVCPYWRRMIIYNGHTLALCGAEKINTVTVDIPDISQLRKCPFNLDGEWEYRVPVIMELPGESVPGYETSIKYLVQASKPGAEGIAQMEAAWDEQVELFRLRYRSS